MGDSAQIQHMGQSDLSLRYSPGQTKRLYQATISIAIIFLNSHIDFLPDLTDRCGSYATMMAEICSSQQVEGFDKAVNADRRYRLRKGVIDFCNEIGQMSANFCELHLLYSGRS